MSPPAGMGTKMLGPDAIPGPTPTPGMGFWVKGDAGLFTAPSVWSDQSGNGYDLTGPGGAGDPTAGAGINGLPTCEFDGVAQFLNTAALMSSMITATVGVGGTTLFSIFIVYKDTKGAGRLGNSVFTPCLFCEATGQIGAWSYVAAAQDVVWGTCTANAATGLVTNGIVPATPTRMSFIQSGITPAANEQSLDLKGTVPVVQDGVFVNSAIGAVYVGKKLGGFAGFTEFGGSIGEIIIYPFALSGPQQTATQSYLDTKWGL